MISILLIAGHGAGDSGAVGNGLKESDLTREFANLILKKLKNTCYVDLADTSRNWFEYLRTNNHDFSYYDYVLEIHFNAGGGTGSEIYVTSSEQGITVEESVLKNLCETAGYANRGVKRKNFTVIQSIKSQGISSALLEVCFVDNVIDIDIYEQKKELLAQAVAIGIAEGFGLSYIPSENDINNNEVIPNWAKNAIDWCNNNDLFPNITVDLTDDKLWFCTLLYNTVRFMAENN